MKCSELWLREWVNPKLNRTQLADRLTMSGLEVEELIPAGHEFTNVVIGLIKKVDQHPHADNLTVCQVHIGKSRDLKIVCGAPNVKVGMKAPVALVNANLSIGPITETIIRDVKSEGMLCSAKELELSEDHTGLMELPSDAPIGVNLKNYLKLNDYIFDISITPNRGDCLSIRGLAREISALTNTPLKKNITKSNVKKFKKSASVSVKINANAEHACPHYVGQVIRHVKTDAETPIWLKECLRRSGIRSIHPIVDITNYVMLELGQPMHAFDLNVLSGSSKNAKGILVRLSHQGEEIKLLDGSSHRLDTKTLVIADHEKALAIAGVMGGLDSGVNLLTQDIFLESAYFSPEVIARQRQQYRLNSESAYRFERGVDPTMQREALIRATQLILEIAGGEPESIIDVTHKKYLPRSKKINLSSEKITEVLGIQISEKDVNRIFNMLQFDYKKIKKNWMIHIPSYRFDLTISEDLIEEIARLYGYDRIPTHHLQSKLHAESDQQPDLYLLKQFLSDRGYDETISYSFIDKNLQTLLDPTESPHPLVNPIVSDMSVMRTNLWPGLINTLIYNKSRQWERFKLFEIGICFLKKGKELSELPKLAGLMMGFTSPEQWGIPPHPADFYDVKGDLESLFSFLNLEKALNFKLAKHAALHPGQTAGIYLEEQRIGIVGALHPSVLQSLHLSDQVFLFELDLNILLNKIHKPILKEISKLPEVRRDIAILVNQAIPAKEIQDTIKLTAGDWLKDVFIFDVYQGTGVSPGLKSIALALIFQHPTRTLVDDEITKQLTHVIETLQGKMGAVLRS